jgi:hypothetical protein
MQTKTTAKDFFLYIGLLITLYSGIGFILTLLFGIINYAFPQVNTYYFVPSISFPVAALIIITPLFLLLSYLIRKDQEVDASKKDLSIRRWFIYLTVFATGALAAGDLITILYYFLDGQELTAGFLLKVLSVLVVSIIVFSYYISELRNKVSHRNVWRVGTIVGVLAVITLAFTVIGSPREQRFSRYDSQKISDLQSIQYQILNRYQMTGNIPEEIGGLVDSLSYFTLPNDPQTGEEYGYEKVSPLTFRLCANFNKESNHKVQSKINYYEPSLGEKWDHPEGNHCFERTINPDLYPVYEKR